MHLGMTVCIWAANLGKAILRSLLKIPFTQRVDHSKKRTLRQSFVVGASDLPPMPAWQPKVGSVASSRVLRSQFRDPDQVEGRAAEHEQPIHLRQSAQFHLLQGPDLFQPSERLLHQPASA
jgi:hypothetical protein